MSDEYKRQMLIKGLEQGNWPEVLYKYRTIEQLEMILDNFSFWFAAPDSFNDPFDCSLSDVDLYSLEDARNHFSSLGIAESVIDQSIKMFEKHPEKLTALVDDVKKKAITNKGILALSKSSNEILLWSHYADYHQGVAIGLEVRRDLNFFLTPIKIDYQSTYQVLNYLQDPHRATIDTLKLKSAEWSYEKEIRVYKNSSGLYPIKPEAIKEIRFGVKSSEEDINKIKKLCMDKGLGHISFFKAMKAHGKFAIEFELA
ncbi:DUF2971 domain-containing protein [Vibrio cyclitrophicus]|uniref:DUF2971 domain-containing protein n=1 Tax=Vibrio cyclitrophicus TaxID=47951 RepID=UPI00080E8A39|nr:DUF2971 domain-containing protein [Vibrio cyclitrophicus]OCH44201.1 hypothetical protein A6E07_19755 [Vibrio cyclitrophicus]